MEKDKPTRTLAERVKRKLGLIAGSGICPETGRTRAEERMIDRIERKGMKAFSMVWPSAETGLRNYSRALRDKQE